MFYLLELSKELEVHPRFFGPKLREEIERRLRQEVRSAQWMAAKGGTTAPPAACLPACCRLQRTLRGVASAFSSTLAACNPP